MRRRIVGVLVAAAALACGHPGTAPAPAPRPEMRAPRNDIHWFRASAEYRGIALEVYRDAGDHLAGLTQGKAPGHWGVILDADETVLDNSLHERELAQAGLPYTDSTWAIWVERAAATAIPGAVDFTARVHRMGGLVVIVSNRADSLCGVTKSNLVAVGVATDLLLCEHGTETDKNPRFAAVEHGTAAAGVPPLAIVEWIGDNIQDFPHLDQNVRDAVAGYHDFGSRYFLLPNPMYGSWTGNAEP